MVLARCVPALVFVLVLSALPVLTGCSGRTVGVDLTSPTDPYPRPPNDPNDPNDPVDPVDPGVCDAAALACDPGDVGVGNEDSCAGAEYCYSRTDACTKSVIWCAHRKAPDCKALPTCNPGDSQVSSCPGGNGSTCYPRTTCGTTILCWHRDACTALPACNPGDKEVTAVDTCSKPGVTCYSRTECNFTLYCYTP